MVGEGTIGQQQGEEGQGGHNGRQSHDWDQWSSSWKTSLPDGPGRIRGSIGKEEGRKREERGPERKGEEGTALLLKSCPLATDHLTLCLTQGRSSRPYL